MDRPTILIVDDEVTVLRSVERTLRKAFSQDIAAAVDFHTALLTAKQLGSRLEMLITDQQLGALRGSDLARHVRYYLPNVAILILTGYQDSDVLEGFDVLGKPVGNDELVAAVQRKLSQRASG